MLSITDTWYTPKFDEVRDWGRNLLNIYKLRANVLADRVSCLGSPTQWPFSIFSQT